MEHEFTKRKVIVKQHREIFQKIKHKDENHELNNKKKNNLFFDPSQIMRFAEKMQKKESTPNARINNNASNVQKIKKKKKKNKHFK